MKHERKITLEYCGRIHPDDISIEMYRVIKAENAVEPRIGTMMTEDKVYELGREGIAYTILPRRD